jgi:uncharacterized protein YcbK (DUF882 family)
MGQGPKGGKIMGDISKDFDRSEHACTCGCGYDTVDVELNTVLQEDIRDYYQEEVIISGPNRCYALNAVTEGASRDSYHTKGKAADIRVKGVSPRAVYHYLDRTFPYKYGLGLYRDRVHIDVRSDKARWDRTT